jgi:type II secretory pathway pseudopilin PulG
VLPSPTRQLAPPTGANRQSGVQAPEGLAREDGFALIEIVVSAAMLALVLLGVFAGIDGSQAVSGQTRSKSIAAALAQQDQERMHAMRTADLSNYQSTRSVSASGISYSVSSRAEWVTDSSGTVSCTNNSGTADYLKITSSVRWSGVGTLHPVKLESLVAAAPRALSPGDGNLSIQILDQASNPVTDIPVAITGPAAQSLSSNQAGCAFFGHLPAGNYQATYSALGYVDPSGANSISVPASVTGWSTNVVTQSYALAGSIAVSFVTQPRQGAQQEAQATTVSVASPNLPSPGTRSFTAASPQSTLSASGLFPFTSGYGVYAGGCSSANPATYDPNYFTKYSGLVTVPPGGQYAVTVWEPALNLLVTRGGLPLSGAHVKVTPTACSDTYPVVSTTAQGGLANPGYPFGTYTVCADDGVHRAVMPNVANTTPAGTPTLGLSIATSGTGGVC